MTCELLHAGRTLRGVLIDASASGAFVQIESRVPVGEDVELRFADASLAPQMARARIARRRIASGAVSAMFRSGVGLEWIEAPAFLGESIHDRVEFVIDGEDLDSSAAGAPPPEPPERSEPAPPPLVEITPAPAQIVGEIAPVEAAPVCEEILELGPRAVRADVAIVDEGDLGGIAQLVQALGASVLRLRWGAQADPIAWAEPPRIVIVSARVALAVPLSDAVLGSGAIGLAISDSGAHTLHTQLRRQGYEWILRRSAHPETQRLFLAALLYRHRERRRHPRRAFGAAARVWHGIVPARARVLELSLSGARVALAKPLPRGARIGLRLRRKLVGGAGLRLAGTVERVASEQGECVVGVRFDGLSARRRTRLIALLDQLAASGPLAEEPSAARLGSAPRRGERRRSPRVAFPHQALALDERSGVARDVLFGSDLSLRGMRIEPHPRLGLGARLRLALQPPGEASPALLEAEVVRDEGSRGLVLRFAETTRLVQRALERMLEAAAEVERTRARESRVVVGTLVEASEPA